MRKVLFITFLLFLVFMFDNQILGDTTYNIYDKYFNEHKYIITSNKNTLKKNDYHNDDISNIIKETDNYNVKDKQELINVYYTAVNNGFDKLTFYCDDNYTNCMNDINNLDGESGDFSVINQLVNAYNSYSFIESSYFNNGRVDITITKRYTNDDIKKIDNKIDEIINELEINNYSDIKTKIKLFHDYLADNNTYDQDMATNLKSDYHSDTAIGALFEGKAVCSGYTDAMSIFLNKIKVKNVRVATDKHVWNGIYLDNNWYHLDLTWDDPVVSDGSNIISYDYFLISTDELLTKEKDEHNYDKNVYNFIK